MYYIKYKKGIYDCWVCIENSHSKVPPINAVITKLSSIALKENDIMEMDYDIGSTTKFKIKYLGSRDLEKGKGKHYPYIIDGTATGMIDDLCDFELKEIVDDIDKKGYSEHYYALEYDYRKYDIKVNNMLLKDSIRHIKNNYEADD